MRDAASEPRLSAGMRRSCGWKNGSVAAMPLRFHSRC